MFVTKAKNRSENAVDFKKTTRTQLQELLERQNKILSNRSFIDGLPDKGEKVRKFRFQIESELNNRCNADRLCRDMVSLNIGKDQLDTLEWTGKHDVPFMQTSSQPDVDDQNVFKMLISHSGINKDKIIINEKPEELLINPSDLIDSEHTHKSLIDETHEFDENVEKYAKNLCGRIDNHKPEKKEHLLLNKPIKPNKHSEVKAAELSLKESVTLQILQENKLKVIEAERAKERSFSKFNTRNYRDVKLVEFDDILETESEEDDFLHDED